MTTESAPTPMRLQRSLVLALVVLAAVAAVLVEVAVARSAASGRSDDLAQQATDASATVVTALVAGLGGAAGIVGADGSVRVGAFDAYAQDVVRQSPAQAVALVSIVRDEDRQETERALGRPIVDQVGGQPAGRRPQYYVVRRITPVTGDSDRLIGLDIGRDAVRSDAVERALASGMTVISAPLPSLPTGELAFFVAKPLYRAGADGSPRTDQPAALVTTVFLGERLLDGVTSQLPTGTRFELRDGDAVLAATDPAPGDGATRDVTVLDRRWKVLVAGAYATDYDAAWLVGLVGVVVAGVLGLVLLRGIRYERRLRGATEAMGRLADLSRDLAVATSVDDLAQAVGNHVPAILGAQLAGVAVVEPDEWRLRMIQRPDIPPVMLDAFAEIDLAAGSPIAAAAQDGQPLLLRNAAAIRSDMQARESGALTAAGFDAVGVLPLTVRGHVAAIVGVAWRSPQRLSAGQEARMRTVSEVCTGTLERIESGRLTVERETAMAELARRLSGTSTADEVSAVVFSEARTVVGADHAQLGFVDRAGSALEVQSDLEWSGDTAEPMEEHGADDNAEDNAEDTAQTYGRWPLNAGIPLTEAVVRNRVVWVVDRSERSAESPAVDDGARQVGSGALVALPLRDTAGAPMGALELAWDAPIRPDAALRSALGVIADVVSQTFERVELVDERLREGELNRRLAHLGELLATAGTTDEVVATLAAHSAAAVSAAGAAVGVVDLGRGIVHVVDEMPGEGRTMLLADVPREPAAEAVMTRSRVVTAAGPGDQGPVVAEPLLDHRRRPVGAICLSFPPDHVVDDSNVRAVARLADLAGQALERATITDGERWRTSLLAAFATELSAARSLDEVVEVVVRAGGLPVDADQVSVGLVDESRDLLAVHEVTSGTGDVVVNERSMGSGLDPARDAVDRGETVLLADADEWRRRHPDRAEAAAIDDLAATAAVPMQRVEGGRLGVLAVAWRRPMTFDDQLLATLHLIARQAAQALQRAALHDIEHQVIADLQERLVTDMPDTPGLAIAARYRAAGPGLEMGGDWFAGFPLDGGRLGVIVGDMTGHGMSAVADMAQVRAMTSALLRAGLSLEKVAEQASQFVAESASTVATAVFAVIDPEGGTLHCVVAGQVPPMLVLPDGKVEVLDRLRRPLLGVARADDRGIVQEWPFPPGSLFIAYTDGLIERRGELIDEGIARLRHLVRQGSGEEPDLLADQLLVELLGLDADAQDDVAFVVVQAEARPSPSAGDRASSHGDDSGLLLR